MKHFTILFTLFLLLNFSYCQSDCDPITTFPWHESFEENDDNIPHCWTQAVNTDDWEWNVVDNSSTSLTKAHSGFYQALIALKCSSETVHNAYLISPVFDLSEVNDPVLSFWHLSVDRFAYLTVWYKGTAGPIWHPLQSFSENYLEWQKETIHLPNKSSYYQIEFWGRHLGGDYGELHLDDITISDGELSVSPYSTESYAIAPNPVRDVATISGIFPKQLTLYDFQGEVVLTQNNHSNSIDMSQLPLGIYLLHIISDTGTVFVQKLIKQ